MSLQDIEYLDKKADIRARVMFDAELARQAEIRRLQEKLDTAECMRAAGLKQNDFKRWRREIDGRIRQLNGKKKKDITSIFKPGAKF